MLFATTRGERVPLPLAAVAEMPRLQHVKLIDFTVQEGDVPVLCSARALASLAFTAATPRVSARLRECLKGRIEQFVDVDAGGPSPLRGVHEHEGPDGRPEFALGIDLADDWGLETSSEAEYELRALLAREAPELARQLDYDTDASAVWLLARHPAALTAALAIADAETRRRAP